MQTPNNQYNYVDPLNQYTLSSGVLLNKANIEDEKVLLAYESIKVSKRLEELYLHPIGHIQLLTELILEELKNLL